MTERNRTTESRIRAILSSWQFWMGVAYMGLTVVVVSLIVEFSHINSAERLAFGEQTTRIATGVATANANYRACQRSIPTLERVNRFVKGVQTLHATLLENAVATHRSTPPGSDTYRTQERNLVRLQQSVELVQGIHFPVPTLKQCAAARTEALSSIAAVK